MPNQRQESSPGVACYAPTNAKGPVFVGALLAAPGADSWLLAADQPGVMWSAGAKLPLRTRLACPACPEATCRGRRVIGSSPWTKILYTNNGNYIFNFRPDLRLFPLRYERFSILHGPCLLFFSERVLRKTSVYSRWSTRSFAWYTYITYVNRHRYDIHTRRLCCGSR